jgi:hypothetical protein
LISRALAASTTAAKRFRLSAMLQLMFFCEKVFRGRGKDRDFLRAGFDGRIESP